MKEFKFSALCLIAALFAGIQSGSGQVINATVPNVSSRPAPSRGAPAPKAFGVANPAIAPRVARRPVTAQVPAARPQAEPRESPKNVPGKKGHNKNERINDVDAFRRHWHEW